jgi:outer membrane protein OmpA-like peptidoglycan-associated protein
MLCSKKISFTVALMAILLVDVSAFAGNSPQEISQRVSNGNPIAGKDKSTLCQGCHGEFGISTMPNIPNLAGQWSAYIMRELRDFWSGSRSDAIMTDMAGTVTSNEDAFDISAYFASQNLMTLTPHKNEEGKRLYIIYQCISCHGIDGQGQPGNNAMFPIIGGQHKEYLIKQLDEFRTGLRETDMSGTMPILAKRMSAAETEAITDYLSGIGEAPAPIAPVVTEIVPAPVVIAPISEVWKILLEDKPIQIEGTNFVTNSAKLKPIASKQLNGVVEFAKQYPEPVLTVVGYTDNTGSNKLNDKLSLARADSVKLYLVKKGISAERISTKGESANNPIGDNKTISGRAKNRRVEIRAVIKEEKKVLVK